MSGGLETRRFKPRVGLPQAAGKRGQTRTRFTRSLINSPLFQVEQLRSLSCPEAPRPPPAGRLNGLANDLPHSHRSSRAHRDPADGLIYKVEEASGPSDSSLVRLRCFQAEPASPTEAEASAQASASTASKIANNSRRLALRISKSRVGAPLPR